MDRLSRCRVIPSRSRHLAEANENGGCGQKSRPGPRQQTPPQENPQSEISRIQPRHTAKINRCDGIARLTAAYFAACGFLVTFEAAAARLRRALFVAPARARPINTGSGPRT